ncbi:MAG: hypothetical protein K6F50_07245 [Kiritimatiellae bacterium]|nr:hypothetical protein [Kiritimatiellia bacterium]
MIAVLAAAALAASGSAVREEAFAEDATPREILAACRQMVPEDVKIDGHVNRRSRHGTQVAAYTYSLVRKDGSTEISFKDADGKDVPFEKHGRLLDTDIMWSDLAMDFLWWEDVSFAGGGNGEDSVHGISCRTLLLRKGNREYKAWIDRRTGALLQAHELRDGRTVREIFCTSLKKFGERWAPRNLEVGSPGARYRTKIVIENIE